MPAKAIQLNLTGLTNPQKRLLSSIKRFIIACWGRQSGKTTGGLHLILARALKGRRAGVYWYILQTHAAAEVAFNRFWDMLRDTGLLLNKPNESEKFCRLINGATVFFKSGENFEDLRVETLDGVVIDEYRQQHPSLWTKVVRPMLARFGAWAVILSTPNGFEHFSDLFEAAKLDEDWDAFHAPSTEAWWWTPEEIESARSTMSEDEFAQEILAEFREMGVGKVYKNHGTWNQREMNPFAPIGQLWSRHLPLVIGLDFNVGLMAWEIMQFRGRQSYTGDEIAIPDTNTQECAPKLRDKVKGHPAGVVLIGDASGESRRSSATKSDYGIILECLKTAGIQVRNLTHEANGPVKERINICNAALKDSTGATHAWYHPTRVPYLKKDFERVLWRGEDLDKRDGLRTHASDAWGYPVVHYADAWKPKAGKMQVLLR
jgi:Terminase large subunit, T4likevirus-type, N-terminal